MESVEDTRQWCIMQATMVVGMACRTNPIPPGSPMTIVDSVVSVARKLEDYIYNKEEVNNAR